VPTVSKTSSSPTHKPIGYITSEAEEKDVVDTRSSSKSNLRKSSSKSKGKGKSKSKSGK